MEDDIGSEHLDFLKGKCAQAVFADSTYPDDIVGIAEELRFQEEERQIMEQETIGPERVPPSSESEMRT